MMKQNYCLLLHYCIIVISYFSAAVHSNSVIYQLSLCLQVEKEEEGKRREEIPFKPAQLTDQLTKWVNFTSAVIGQPD